MSSLRRRLASMTKNSVLRDAPVVIAPRFSASLKQEITGASATTPCKVGDVVGSWNNVGSLGGYLVAPTTGGRPTLGLANGLFWLLADGTDDSLSMASGVGTLGDFTIIFAAREVVRQDNVTIALLATGDPPRLFAHAPWSDGVLYFDTNGSSGALRFSATAPAVGTDNVYSWRRTGSAVDIRLNGASLGSATSASAITTDQVSFPTAVFGDHYSGRVYGAAVWSRALADIEVRRAERAIGAWAGVPVAT